MDLSTGLLACLLVVDVVATVHIADVASWFVRSVSKAVVATQAGRRAQRRRMVCALMEGIIEQRILLFWLMFSAEDWNVSAPRL